MTIISLKTEAGGDLNRIGLSDGSLFSFRICYLPPELNISSDGLCLNEGDEISAAEEAAFRFASECLRAEKAALRLITRAEQCTFGLSRKLEKRGAAAACISAVISRLLDLGLLDDARFAKAWLTSRLRLARSPRRLFVSLCGRGISRDDAETALKSVLDEETEFVMLKRFVKKYARKAGTDVRSQKYFLKNEGFSHEVIHKFLGLEYD